YLRLAAARDRGRRASWLRLLAHECAHFWWGHRVPSTVLGGGGNWLREGLAEWSGNRAAETVLAGEGGEPLRTLFGANLRSYLRRFDPRRGRTGEVVFGNEVTLRDATYLDPGAVAYHRGALVHRRLEMLLGAEAFRAGLRRYGRDRAHRFTGIDDYVRALDPSGERGAAKQVAYYVATTRLPDLELTGVRAGPGRLEATVSCLDPLWPGGRVPVRITTEGGVRTAFVEVRDGTGTLRWEGKGTPREVEVDPERWMLDPIPSNNRWKTDG
ncbi:MAG: M1 family aminopeptidase, partial [Planctomycetota bacterium]